MLLIASLFAYACASNTSPRKLPITTPDTLTWAGQLWYVKSGIQLPGPGAGNPWLPSHVWVEGSDLHLKLAPSGPSCSAWASSEVWSDKVIGYGNTTFSFTAPLALDPFATFGLFTWADDVPATGGGLAGHLELDFELGTWGSTTDPNAYQLVVQPWTDPANVHRLPLAGLATAAPGSGAIPADCADLGPDGFGGQSTVTLTFVLAWSPGLARFTLHDGLGTGGPAIGAWEMADAVKVPAEGDITTPYGARAHSE